MTPLAIQSNAPLPCLCTSDDQLPYFQGLRWHYHRGHPCNCQWAHSQEPGVPTEGSVDQKQKQEQGDSHVVSVQWAFWPAQLSGRSSGFHLPRCSALQWFELLSTWSSEANIHQRRSSYSARADIRWILCWNRLSCNHHWEAGSPKLCQALYRSVWYREYWPWSCFN